MNVDAIVIGKYNNYLVFPSVPGYVYFRNNYSKYFREKETSVYLRYVNKDIVGSWRFIPNRSTDFYRCKKVDDILAKFLDEKFRSYNADVKK